MLLAVRGLLRIEGIFGACLPTVKRWEGCMFQYHVVLLMSVNVYAVNLKRTIFSELENRGSRRALVWVVFLLKGAVCFAAYAKD